MVSLGFIDVKSILRLVPEMPCTYFNFYLILMKRCTVAWGLKSKIKFVWGVNLVTPSPILPIFYPS